MERERQGSWIVFTCFINELRVHLLFNMAQGTRWGKTFTIEMATAMREIVREEILTAFDIKLQPVNQCLEELKTQLTVCNDKVIDLERAAVGADVRLADLERNQHLMKEENKYLRLKVDQLENYSRKFNIRIIGLAEGVEAGNPTAFTIKLLYDMFGEEVIGPVPLISTAHRTGPARKDSRCMIARLYSFEVKRKIIRLAAESRSLTYNGKRISIYPDLTAEILKQRATFNQVRSELRRLNVRSGFIHPATLILTFSDAIHKFPTAKEAQDFFDHNISRGDDKEGASSTNG